MRESLKFLKPYLMDKKMVLFLFYFGWLFEICLSIISPIIFSIMINQIVYYSNLKLFISLGFVFAITLFFECIIYYILYELYNQLWNSLSYHCKKDLFDKYLNMTVEELYDTKEGDVAGLILWQSFDSVDFVVRNIIHNINNYIRIILYIYLLFAINPIIGGTIIFILPLSLWINNYASKKVREKNNQSKSFYGDYMGWLNEMLSSLMQIRILGGEKHVFKLLKQKQKDIQKSDLDAEKMIIITNESINFINMIFQLILYSVLGIALMKSSISIGSVIVVIAFYISLKDSIKKVVENQLTAQNRIATIDRMRNIISKKQENQEWLGKSKVTKITGKIVIKNLRFFYKGNEDKIVLNDMDLEINMGEKIAIVGESGCGKTSLIFLIIGFLKSKHGEILIEDKELGLREISEFDLISLRDRIGIVQQNMYIFRGTILENIRAGCNSCTEEEVIFAAKTAGIHEFIMELEGGYNTIIGAGGRELSGGQIKRIVIARVFLKNPDLIIMDEATSALDEKTEIEVMDSFKKNWRDKTAIIITHRKSTVEICDKVAIMKHGKIIEIGKVEEVIDKSKRFKKLFALEESMDEKVKLS